MAVETTDFLIVGAGFAGLVTAQILAANGWKCTVVDQRSHIGGNAHDFTDAAGVLVHAYGPHYFRTNSPRIIQYLSQFTDWHHVNYTIKSFTQNRYWSFPINLNTFEEYLNRPSSETEFIDWLNQHKSPFISPKNSEEVILSQVGEDFYHLFFKPYTLKQWKRHPRDLDPSVCGRIPIRTNRDDRYLSEEFQALPAHGYSAMFESMLAQSPNISLSLETDAKSAITRWKFQHLIYTGPIDAFFNYQFGPLPYRSLHFEHESFTPEQLSSRHSIAGKPGFWQCAMQVNYPDPEVPFTRIVEIKHATGQSTPNTTIVREYPKDWNIDQDPYYPIPAEDSHIVYQKYANLAKNTPHTSFIGRLATYKYYNMDQVTGMAIAEAERLLTRYGRKT